MSEAQSPADPLATRRLASFSVIAIATGGFSIPLQAFLPVFYAKSMGLGLQTVGLVFLIARLWAALSDPLIGWLSDHTVSRYGRRKPWIIGGGLLFLAATVAVFFPPSWAGAWWLGLGLFTLCIGWTATSTPLYAWGGELSAEPHQRARVQAFIQTGVALGIFLILLMPALFDLLKVGAPALRVQAMGLFTVVALAIGLILIGTQFKEAAAVRTATQAHWWAALREVGRDRLLWRIIASDFFVALGQGSRGAVFVFVVGSYMGLGIASVLMLIQFSVGIFAAPLWARISYRLGRRNTLVLAELLQVAINLSLLLLTPERAWLLVALVIAQGATQGAGNLMLRAMIYDVADRHRQATGIERAGLFSSLFNVTNNAAMAIAIGIGFFVIGQFGFSPNGANDARALAGLLGFFAIGPAIGHMLSAAVMLRYPDEAGVSPVRASSYPAGAARLSEQARAA